MIDSESRVLVHRSVVEALTVEAMVLADELETYLAEGGSEVGVDEADAAARLRLMRAGDAATAGLTLLVDWLVWRDTAANGAPPFDPAGWGEHIDLSGPGFAPHARALFAAAKSVFERASALETAPRAAVEGPSPARVLQERLARSLGT